MQTCWLPAAVRSRTRCVICRSDERKAKEHGLSARTVDKEATKGGRTLHTHIHTCDITHLSLPFAQVRAGPAYDSPRGAAAPLLAAAPDFLYTCPNSNPTPPRALVRALTAASCQCCCCRSRCKFGSCFGFGRFGSRALCLCIPGGPAPAAAAAAIIVTAAAAAGGLASINKL